jgi:hypothetical protein
MTAMLAVERINPGDDVKYDSRSLADFFRVGYGNRYLGDEPFIRDYVMLAGKAIALCAAEPDGNEVLGVSLVRAERVTAAVTTLEQGHYERRRDIMAHLLVATQLIEPSVWITIAVNAVGMISAAEKAGMTPISDLDDVRARIDTFGELDTHELAETNSGIAVRKVGSAHGTGYEQVAWGWAA